jgi:DNA invertase Pin-like site-specific DNA recombinase
MNMSGMKVVRCAIYTRKSSEEGLEQGFNSLHAQREACAAYVLSQASEGWTLAPEIYDDGGLSGGTLERPALQQLLADVAAGQVDIIVVYKVDRLTRSLLDFAKLVEALDQAGTSFVSITQSFNTTTSMGRLTLNMLLSFAQFEREVTAERIRDKLAASKAKGMWMGGNPPLGYRPDGRSLAIVEEHAALVRQIYARYKRLGTVRLVADQLIAKGITVPQRTTSTGRTYGGGAFSRGQLYALLRNPIYVGDIPHKGKVYPGQHPALIARAAWDAVQRQLDAHIQGARRALPSSDTPTCLLAGRIVDGAGAPLLATHARKGTRRNRYYVSKALQTGTLTDRSLGIRLPASEVEQLVAQELAAVLADPLDFAERTRLEVAPDGLAPLLARCKALAAALQTTDATTITQLVAQVRVLDTRLEIDLCTQGASTALALPLATDAPPVLTLTSAVRLTRTGRAIRLVHTSGGVATASEPDLALARLVARASDWWRRISEEGALPSAIAAEEQVTSSYVARVLRLAFLAPVVVEAILDGRLKAGIDGSALLQTDAIALGWEEQAAMMVAS